MAGILKLQLVNICFPTYFKLPEKWINICAAFLENIFIDILLIWLKGLPIRKYLSNDATKELVHALVTSRLGMENFLLYGLPDLQIKRFNRLQNIAPRIITRTKLTEHIFSVPRDLHWLAIKDRIIFKIQYLSMSISQISICYLCKSQIF